MVRNIREIVEKITALPHNPYRVQASAELIDKLYTTGLIHTKRLKKCQNITVKSFCRRRLPVYIVQSGMIEAPLSVAGKYI